MAAPIELLLSRLEHVRQRGDDHRAKCPAHDGKTKDSLSVKEGDDGRVLVHCHGGCEQEAVCRALGLELSDLFPDDGKGKHRQRSRPVPIAPRIEGAIENGGDLLPEDPEAAVREWIEQNADRTDADPRNIRLFLANLDGFAFEVVRKKLASVTGWTVPRLRELYEAARHEAEACDTVPKSTPDPAALYEQAKHILEAPDVLTLFQDELHALGFAGDTAVPELVYLAVHSRHFGRPINIDVRGPSAAGKSFAVTAAIDFHPDDAVHRYTAASERAFIYTERDFKHRHIFIGESSALHHEGVGASILRTITSESRIDYETVEKTTDGMKSRRITKEGPTGLITTSTKDLDPEVETRLVQVQVTDSAKQTRAVLEVEAREAQRGGGGGTPDTSVWHAAATWLTIEGEKHVRVPYAEALAGMVPADAVRMRRDFKQVLSFIEAHAFLHQASRERDEAGAILADRADYDAAHRLLGKALAVTMNAVTDATRETVEVVRRLSAGGDSVTYRQLADALKLNKSSAWHRVKEAAKHRYLVVLDNESTHSVIEGEPLPEDRPVLPMPAELFDTPGDTPPISTQRCNGSAQTLKNTGREGVARPVATHSTAAQQADPLQQPMQHLKPAPTLDERQTVAALHRFQRGTSKTSANRPGSSFKTPEMQQAIREYRESRRSGERVPDE